MNLKFQIDSFTKIFQFTGTFEFFNATDHNEQN